MDATSVEGAQDHDIPVRDMVEGYSVPADSNEH